PNIAGSRANLGSTAGNLCRNRSGSDPCQSDAARPRLRKIKGVRALPSEIGCVSVRHELPLARSLEGTPMTRTRLSVFRLPALVAAAALFAVAAPLTAAAQTDPVVAKVD